MRERLIRLLIIIVSAFVVVGGVKWIASQNQKNPQAINLIDPIKKKLEDVGEKVLGSAVKHLPKAPDLEGVGEDQADEPNQDESEAEPIQEPVKNIQNQTQQLVESIKKLPQDQIEAVKQQILKGLCEEFKCGEDDD